MGNSARTPKTATPEPGEPERFDLRESLCFPYLPVENQGSALTCVAHSFAMALFCDALQQGTVDYPQLELVFAEAMRKSPDPSRGVSFAAVASAMGSARFQQLPNSAARVRRALRAGQAVVAGYQVNDEIDRFHRSVEQCEAHNYVLPRFRKWHRSKSGHAVLLVGYDFRAQAFVARNSWGEAWGVHGHFLIPFQTVEDLAAVTDLWAVTK